MSLKSKSRNSCVAEKSITCYKLVGISEDGKICTPFQTTNCIIENDEIRLMNDVDDDVWFDETDDVYLISKHGIHALTNSFDALQLFLATTYSIGKKTFTRDGKTFTYVIVKCHIEPQTQYWHGTYTIHEADKQKMIIRHEDVESYCAKKLKIDNLIRI